MAGYLIDTNVVSELIKPRPSPRVVAWMASTDDEACFLSVLSIGELRKGARRLQERGETTRAERLEAWMAETAAVYGERVLAVDLTVARAWADLGAGRTLPVVDALCRWWTRSSQPRPPSTG